MFAAETTEIADAVGGLLLVTDVRQRQVDEIGEALAELSLTGTPVLGVVLNRVRPTNQRGELTYYYAPAESRKPADRAR
jgi:Mrp family chromosome partitioning ATPase